MKLDWKLLVISGAAVGIMTIASSKLSVPPVLFYALWPGVMAHLAIAGGHGGTTLQDVLARIVEISLNTLVYFCLLLLCKTQFSRAMTRGRQGAEKAPREHR